MSKRHRNKLPVECFRSYTLLLEADKDAADFSVPTKELLSWLHSCDDWFKSATGIQRGENLHLLYNRSVAIISSDILEIPEKAIQLSGMAAVIGCRLQVYLDLERCKRHLTEFKDICGSGVGAVHLALGKNGGGAETEEEVYIVETMIDSGIEIVFHGDVSAWAERKCLNLQLLNAANFHIRPGCTKSSVSAVDGFNPCLQRFQLFLDGEGMVYPCQGLIGLKDYSFGSIGHTIEETYLGGGRDYPLNILLLSKQGPEVRIADHAGELSRQMDFEKMPAICRLHRLELSRGAI